jgi:hypothetical protein
MSERCDQVPDCRDESDEDDCKIIVLKPSYNKRVPPITTVSETNKTIVPVQVTISIVLMQIVNILESDDKIEIQFEIVLKWKENKRVKYHNLKDNIALNVLTDENLDDMWLPLVIYDNTDQKEETRLGMPWEWGTSVTINREEESPERSGLDIPDEIEVFQGEKNTLTMNQTYTWKFQCEYDLHLYPFDTQVMWPDMSNILTTMS